MVAKGGSGNMQQSMYSIGGYLLDLHADHARLHGAFPAKAHEEQALGWLPDSTATVIQATLSKIATAAEALGTCLSADSGVVSGSGQHVSPSVYTLYAHRSVCLTDHSDQWDTRYKPCCAVVYGIIHWVHIVTWSHSVSCMTPQCITTR